MIRLDCIDSLRRWRLDQEGHTVGLVPTLGGLHDGHLSLVRRAVAENQRTVASVFLNPAQFNEAADLESYPLDLERDCRLLEEAGCDAVYHPAADDVYPAGFQTWIEVGAIGEPLEGVARPGHFRGVATVVLKLFNQVRPHRAYFGEKDFQQVAVIETMVRDLDLAVEIVRCPTVREADGLAMSTRNQLLSPEQRVAATVLQRALSAAREAHAVGERDPEGLRARMRDELARERLAVVDYLSASDPVSLAELPAGEPAADFLLSLAVRFGDVRLIDNLLLSGSEA